MSFSRCSIIPLRHIQLTPHSGPPTEDIDLKSRVISQRQQARPLVVVVCFEESISHKSVFCFCDGGGAELS
jgi:hypothetical protein